MIDDLVSFASARFVNRWDAYGTYSNKKTWTEKTPLTSAILTDHFSGRRTIGCHAIAIGNTCKWGCLDFDNHDHTAAVGEANLAAVHRLQSTLIQRGLTPLVEDSDGGGSYKVWILFDDPVPSANLYAYLREHAPEAFPKQRGLGPDTPYGNYVRLPGKHHKRDHWSRFNVDGEWYTGEDAWHVLLDAPINDSLLVPAAPEIIHAVVNGAPVYAAEGIGVESKGESDPFADAAAALFSIPISVCDTYDDWFKIGAALHSIDSTEAGLALFKRWSRRSSKNKEGDCEKLWGRYKAERINGVGIGTLIYYSDRGEVRVGNVIVPEEREIEGLPPRDRALAMLRKKMGIPIERWVQYCPEAGKETYCLYLCGVENPIIMGDAAAVVSRTRFKTSVYGQSRMVVRASSKSWNNVLQWLADICEVVDVPEDTEAAVVRNLIEGYLSSSRGKICPDCDETILANRAFVRDGMVHLSIKMLTKWARIEGIQLTKIGSRLANMGWMAAVINVAGTTRQYRAAPIDNLSVPEEVLAETTR